MNRCQSTRSPGSGSGFGLYCRRSPHSNGPPAAAWALVPVSTTPRLPSCTALHCTALHRCRPPCPQWVKSDHEAHSGEEAMKTLKRISGGKYVSGPSRRLAAPAFPVVATSAASPASRKITTLDELEGDDIGGRSTASTGIQTGTSTTGPRREPRRTWTPRPGSSRV